MILRPAITAVFFTVIFHRIAKLESPGSSSYLDFVLVAILPWQFFSASLLEGSNYLIENPNLVRKVYFPRALMPLSALISNFFDFAVLLGLWMIYFLCHAPQVSVLGLATIFLIAIPYLILLTMGAVLLLAALNVRFRDFRYVIPFLIQIGTFITPIGFSTEIIPSEFKFFYYMNPLTGLVDLFRFGFWAQPLPPPSLLAVSVVSGLAIFILGLSIFEKTERNLSEIL